MLSGPWSGRPMRSRKSFSFSAIPARTSLRNSRSPTDSPASRSARPSAVSASAARRARVTAYTPAPAPATNHNDRLIPGPVDGSVGGSCGVPRGGRHLGCHLGRRPGTSLVAQVPSRLPHVAASLSAGPLDLAVHLEPDPVAVLRRHGAADPVAQGEDPHQRLAERGGRELPTRRPDRPQGRLGGEGLGGDGVGGGGGGAGLGGRVGQGGDEVLGAGSGDPALAGLGP